MPKPKRKAATQGTVKEVIDLREKATLLLSKQSPFFSHVQQQLGIDKIKDHCMDLYGINFATINSWKNGVPKTGSNTRSLEEVAENINAIYENVEQTPKHFPATLDFMISNDKYNFGELLGLKWKETRRILDEELYLKSLATTLLTMPEKDEHFLDSLKGFCIAWHKTPTVVENKIEYRLVRSLVDICDPVLYSADRCVYRCRWHLPLIKPNAHFKDLTHYHYLGSVAYTKENKTYTWLFEPKNSKAVEDSPDFPYFLTQEFNDNDTIHSGFYVSKSQDQILYSSKIALCKVDETCLYASDESLESYFKFLSEIIDQSKFDSLQDAQNAACCDNEKKLLRMFEPTCKVLQTPS